MAKSKPVPEFPPGLGPAPVPLNQGGTNSLCVTFLAGNASVSLAYKELSVFGELARVEVPPGQQAVAVASFYDLRAAARAKAALVGRCAEAPQHGERTVVVKGDVEIQPWMVTEVASVRKSGDGSMYFLDFYDTRTAGKAAAQFHARNVGVPQERDRMPMKVPVSNSLEGTPRKRNDLRLSQVHWDDLSSGREWRTTLRLRCLPKQLCDEEALKSLLARAGLAEAVDLIRAFPGQGNGPGTALVNAVDSAGAAAVAKYLHGRSWGRTMPISVGFAALQGAEEVDKAFPKAKASPADLAKAVPWRVEMCGLRAPDEVGASEASTEVGDDAEHIAA